MYRNADVYLLDDPLSAVDAAVSRHIFDRYNERSLLNQYAVSNFRCIRGHLCDHAKCVILVTHQLQYINECDNVMILKEVL